MSKVLIDPNTKNIITPSNTWLYYRRTEKGVFHYHPYSIDHTAMLKTIKLALMGDEIAKDSVVFQNSFIRFGWLDKGLKDLKWVSLPEVLSQLNEKTLKKSNRIKLDHICRLLFISIKDIKHD